MAANPIFKDSPWGEYEVVGLRLGWTGASYLLLVLAVSARYVLPYLPWRPENPWLWPLLVSASVPVLSLAGAVAAYLGLRRSNSPIPPRLSLVLNALVFLFSGLAVLGMFYLLLR